MDLLIQWVTQIVIFIILATIIDMLVPSSSMQKYVRLVAGLVLLLLLLQPIFSLFQIDINRSINASIEEVNQELEDQSSEENLTNLKKSEIEKVQDAYILEQMAVQLTELANEPLAENYQVTITDIQFTFRDNGNIAYEGLEEVIVYLDDSNSGEGATDAVDDIVIDGDTSEQAGGEEPEELGEVKELLREIWELDGQKLLIKWEGGKT